MRSPAGKGSVRVVGIGLLALLGGCRGPDPVERLAEALPYTVLEARLSGSFPAAACPGAPGLPTPGCAFPEVGTPAFEALAAATAEVEGARGPSAARARALAELIWSVGGLGSAATAAEALEALALDEAGDPHLLSDWAAAELTRGAAEDRAYPHVLALEAAERALTVAPDHAPARYNRALALDRLGFGALSAEAWSAYLELDPSSPWGQRARERLARLREPPPADGSEPQRRREAVLDSLLPAWGRALGAGDENGAGRALAEAAGLASGLAAGSVRRAVADVERIWRTSPSRSRRLASALEAFGEGRRHYSRGDDDEAIPYLAAAAEAFAPLSPDLRDWASVWRAAADLGRTRYEEVEAGLAPVAARQDPRESPVLAGLAGWLRGVAMGRRGRYGVALGHHQAAAQAMSRSGETGYAAFLWTLVAEDQTLLGNPPEAWEARQRSFEAFRLADDPGLLRGALSPAVEDLRSSGLLHAALFLQNHAVALSRAGMPGNLLSEDLVRRATLLLALGRDEEAQRDLVQARRVATAIPDGTSRAFSMAQLWSAEGALAGRRPGGEPRVGDALALLDSAVAFHESRSHGHFLLDLHLQRSRLHRRGGAMEAAQRELEAALALVENTRSGIDDPATGIRFAEASRGMWDAGLGLHLVARRDPWSALRWMERVRGLTTPWLEVPTRGEPIEPSALPEDLAVVAYASMEDSLFVWLLRDTGAETLALPVSRETLQGAGRELSRRARRARSRAELRPTAEIAGRLLLPDTLRSLLGSRDVVFVPDPVLAGLPFAALAADEGWLLEERAVAVAPSLSLVRSRLEAAGTTPGRGEGRTVLLADPAVADDLQGRYPGLPAAREELAALRALYPRALVLAGRDAHAGALVGSLERTVEVLHLAGHAVSAPDVPGGSHLVLAPEPDPGRGSASENGLLYAHTLASRRFQGPELVVLTACSSVAPRPGSLGGFQGIALPFLERGTSAVVGTLWEIEDQAAARIASAFHTGWLGGLPAREALRQAQLQGLRAGNVPPRVWSAFQVVGLAGNPRAGSVRTSTAASTQRGEADGV